MARDWSELEVHRVVADYMDMLDKYLSGTSFVKAEHRRALIPQLDDRTHRAIEFKHRNISSVLDELGLVWLDGYHPAPNRQNLLVEEVLRVVSTSSGIAAAQECEREHIDEAVADADRRPIEIALRAIAVRRGQPGFRRRLLDSYEGLCAVTGEGPEEVLEAAHIQPYSLAGINTIDNGLLLRADIHTLFDLGLIEVTPVNRKIRVDEHLSGTAYYEYNDNVLIPRVDGTEPSDGYIRQRNLINRLRSAR